MVPQIGFIKVTKAFIIFEVKQRSVKIKIYDSFYHLFRIRMVRGRFLNYAIKINSFLSNMATLTKFLKK